MPCVSDVQREQVRCPAAMAHLRSAASRCHDVHAHLQHRDPSLVPLCACSRRAVDGGDRAAQHAQVILAVPWVGVACGGDAGAPHPPAADSALPPEAHGSRRFSSLAAT